MGHPCPLFHLFSSFQTNIPILTTKYVKKCYVHQVYVYRHSNPQPLEHESPPITTRPGLPPNTFIVSIVTIDVAYF